MVKSLIQSDDMRVNMFLWRKINILFGLYLFIIYNLLHMGEKSGKTDSFFVSLPASVSF
jgi:hypothetical protein